MAAHSWARLRRGQGQGQGRGDGGGAAGPAVPSGLLPVTLNPLTGPMASRRRPKCLPKASTTPCITQTPRMDRTDHVRGLRVKLKEADPCAHEADPCGGAATHTHTQAPTPLPYLASARSRWTSSGLSVTTPSLTEITKRDHG